MGFLCWESKSGLEFDILRWMNPIGSEWELHGNLARELWDSGRMEP